MTKIMIDDVSATFEGRKWHSESKLLADLLDRLYWFGAPSAPADGHPAGTAVKLAKEMFPKLVVVEMDPPYPPTEPGCVN
jgi:hypothetical protein